MSLQGTLKTLGITEVLEFLSARAATGRLDVSTEMGTASYAMFEGLVATAEYSFMRESGVDAAEATYYVVSELDGTFYFEEDHVPTDVDDAEAVGSVLSRTADIAERWTEVEEVIPSANHLLIRNNELDGSVTIQPEWWKALEVIGEGRTSLQLATALDLGSLDASLTALAMTRAGLLKVRELDPLEIDVEVTTALDGDADSGEPFESASEPAPEEVEPVDIDHVQLETEQEIVAEPDPVDMLEMVEIEEPTPPLAHDSFFSAPAVDAVEPVAPAAAMAEMQQIVADLAEPVVDFAEPVAEQPAPQPLPDDPFDGPSGMDDFSELEYMVESNEYNAPVSNAQATEEAPLPVHDTTETAPVVEPVAVVAEDDDGWSTHSMSRDELRPVTAAEPAPIGEPELEPEAALLSPFDVIDVPTADPEPSPVDTAPMAPELSVEDLPAPPPPLADTFEPAAAAPVPESHAPPPFAEPADATTMAGEVLDDLASMTDDLDAGDPADENWTLDGTFVPEAETVPPAEADPFGDLGQLLNDSSSDDERSSVLKFLRRD